MGDWIRKVMIGWGVVVCAAIVCAALVVSPIGLIASAIGLPRAILLYALLAFSFMSLVKFFMWTFEN
ncbi:MAG: hypothetical protein AB7U76_25820 [Pirellulales bacterium]